MEETIWDIRLRELSERRGEQNRKLKEVLEKCSAEVSAILGCEPPQMFYFSFAKIYIQYQQRDGLNPGEIVVSRHSAYKPGCGH